MWGYNKGHFYATISGADAKSGAYSVSTSGTNYVMDPCDSTMAETKVCGLGPDKQYVYDLMIAQSGRNCSSTPLPPLPSGVVASSYAECGTTFSTSFDGYICPVACAAGIFKTGSLICDDGCDQTVVGGDLFYAFDFPNGASANTGYESAQTLTMYFVQDALGDAYLVMAVGKPNATNGLSGALNMSATSTGLVGSMMSVIRSDDAGEVTWDNAQGTGTFEWAWESCCGDGAVLGPMPSTGFSITFSAAEWSNVHTVKLASYDPTASDLEFVTLDTAAAFGDGRSVRVSGFTCKDYCASLPTCGDCTASEYCGWCGWTSTCVSGADVSAGKDVCASDYTPPLTCCAICKQQPTAAACLSVPGCGFLFDRATPDNQTGFCVSGTPATTPNDCLDPGNTTAGGGYGECI